MKSMPDKAAMARSVERGMMRLLWKGSRVVPVPLAALAFAWTRLMQGRTQEVAGYLWLAGLRQTPPGGSSSDHADDFDSDHYFASLEDEAYGQYIQSNARLVQWATPERETPICDLGCGRGFLLRELRSSGYVDLTGFEISRVAVARRVTPEVTLFPGFDTMSDRAYETVCLISVLEHLEKRELDHFLQQVTRITRTTVVCCTPIYPNNLSTFFDRDLTHRTLATRRWWDRQFRAHGFLPAPLPPEPLPYVEPFVYQRESSQD